MLLSFLSVWSYQQRRCRLFRMPTSIRVVSRALVFLTYRVSWYLFKAVLRADRTSRLGVGHRAILGLVWYRRILFHCRGKTVSHSQNSHTHVLCIIPAGSLVGPFFPRTPTKNCLPPPILFQCFSHPGVAEEDPLQ